MSMHLDANDFSVMDDGQRIAVLEAMIAGMVADNRVTPSEIRRFDEIVLGLPWGVSGDVLGAMIKGAKERVIALETAQVQDYVHKLAERIPTPELRDKVVFTMATLMLSDGELAQVEKNVLGLFVLTFGITPERASAIREALHIPAKPSPAPIPSDEVN